MQLLWYGHSRTLFTYEFIEELLFKAGFSDSQCLFKETNSAYGDIVELDRREQESLFIEAFGKQSGSYRVFAQVVGAARRC